MSSTFHTPPAVAESIGVNVDKVLAWIRTGELKASNVAAKLGGRPRYRIAETELQAFLDRRAAASIVSTPAKPKRRRAEKPAGFVRYFS